MIVRKRWLFLLLYLGLLVASHLVRRGNAESGPLPDTVQVERLSAVNADGEATGEQIDLAYRFSGPGDYSHADTPVLLALHGSPGSSRDFFAILPEISQERRVLIPDLPGFGYSTRDLPDYSLRAHAHYVRELLDRLEIDTVDLMGFSMGGGVALELADLIPDRVRSLILLSSIGVQEFELLGNYEINHAIHGLQLGGLWLLFEAVPHFGVLDGGMISMPYARNFYDTDQRPLRVILEHFEPPVLIVHGDRDPLVPTAAALEHHRIVPQSRLVLLEGDHFMVFTRGDEFIQPVREFLAAVDAGEAPTRSQATAERVARARQPYDPSQRVPASGFSLVVIMLLMIAGTLVSEDLTCIGAGLLVAQGAIGFLPAVAACVTGIVVGDIGLYWAGRLIGEKALQRRPFRWVLSEGLVAESAAWFDKQGPLVILISRFVPGTRLATYFTSGLLKTGFLKFTFFFILASMLWTPLLVGAASLVGERFFSYFDVFRRHAPIALLLLVILVWLIARTLPALFSWRGRRLLLSRYRRLTHWEFWPWWIVYLPVVARIALLALRHRSATLFTLSNPGMEGGGFVGESKGDLLEQMPPDSVPRFIRLDAELEAPGRLARIDTFLAQAGVELPLILKPDRGERGFRVARVDSREGIEAYLRDSSRPTLVQEYVEGVEYGVFYVREPGAPQGEITSIARKILPVLRGDGHSTLEELILRDDRAVCSATMFLGTMAGSLMDVPARDEVVELGHLGTHSRGAVFLDANTLRTPELEAAVDRIAQTVDGFYFGRFDLRAPTERSFSLGEDLKVLELNGVTSEEAHMYDPAHGYAYAVRTLSAQWRRAFEIGALNRERGHTPTGLTTLVGEIWQYHRRKSD